MSAPRPAYVSINAHTIRRNAMQGTRKPPIRIALSRSDKKPRYASEIAVRGPVRLVYQPEARILACGARMVMVVENREDLEIVR